MAADWIKVDVTTPDKPEVFRIAEATGADPDAVVGKLIRVWVWADQQTTNGNVPSVTRLLLDRLTNVPGFADALVNVGWLSDSGDGLTFNNFDRHNGKTAKTRALTVHRVRQHRNANVTQAALPRDRVIENRDKKEKSVSGRVSSKKKRKPAAPGFQEFWESFPPLRKAKRGDAEIAFEKAIAFLVSIGTPSPDDFLIQRAKDYAASPKGQGEYASGPTPWLNGKCWDDAPEAWGLANATTSSPAKKTRVEIEREEVAKTRALRNGNALLGAKT